MMFSCSDLRECAAREHKNQSVNNNIFKFRYRVVFCCCAKTRCWNKTLARKMIESAYDARLHTCLSLTFFGGRGGIFLNKTQVSKKKKRRNRENLRSQWHITHIGITWADFILHSISCFSSSISIEISQSTSLMCRSFSLRMCMCEFVCALYK